MAVEFGRGGITKGRIAQFVQKVGDFCPSDWTPIALAKANAQRKDDIELREYLNAYHNFQANFSPIRGRARCFTTEIPLLVDKMENKNSETFLDLSMRRTDEYYIFTGTTDTFQRYRRGRQVKIDVLYLDIKSNIIKLFESAEQTSRYSRETGPREHTKEFISTLDLQTLHTFPERTRALERIIFLLERMNTQEEEVRREKMKREVEIWGNE